MQKLEAIREWCLERAMAHFATYGTYVATPEHLIEAAKKFEDYITEPDTKPVITAGYTYPCDP